MLKILDGQKRLVLVLGFIASGLTTLVTGQDVGAYFDLLLRALGWNDPALISGAQAVATQVVPLLFAIWAAASALLKLWKQHKAGATVTELGSAEGVIKAAAIDGTLRIALLNTLPADTDNDKVLRVTADDILPVPPIPYGWRMKDGGDRGRERETTDGQDTQRRTGR